MGRPLVAMLVARGHRVRALARERSAAKLPAGVEPVIGNALDASTYAAHVAPCDTLVHLVGTPHPSPAKAAAFREVDLASVAAAVHAANAAEVRHFVYVSVAQPAPVMRAYIEVRRKGEALLAQSGIAATILRPWYVLGPGHRWPIVLKPLYALFEALPATRDSARRLGLVTLEQMIASLVHAVEHRPARERILDVPALRAASLAS